MGEVLVEDVVAAFGELGLDPVAAVVVRLGRGDAEAEGALLHEVGEGALLVEADGALAWRGEGGEG